MPSRRVDLPGKPLFGLLLSVVILLTQGCSLFRSRIDPNNQNVALVFAYIDMKEAPSAVDWAFLKRYKAGGDDNETGYYMTGEDGLLYHVGVDMGSYQIVQFGRNTRWYSNVEYTYDFDTGGRNLTAKRIKAPGVYFLGSYAYKKVASGSWFKPDKFTIVPMAHPTEKEALRKVLKDMEDDSSEYTHQMSWIRKRISELKD